MVALVLLVVAYLPTLLAFGPVWLSALPQGFPTAALCAWLLWRDRRDVLAVHRPLRWVVPMLAGLSLLWLAGGILTAQVLQMAFVPIVAWGWLLATGGWAPARTAAPIAATFLLAVPGWDALTRPLQWLTVEANAILLRSARIDASIDGDLIRIPAGTFWVAEGCAGIDYFQIGLLVGVAYALLFLRTWRARLAVISASVACVIVMNWLRVFGLIVVGHTTDMQSSLMRDHGTYGWILFGVAQALFLLIARRIDIAEERILESVPAGRGGAPAPHATHDAAPTPTVPWPRRSTRQLVLATLAAVSGPLLHVALAVGRTPSTAQLAADASVTPPAGWTAVADAEPGFRPAFSGADLAAHSTWQRGDVRVQVNRFLYADQRQGKELIAYGNVITPDSLRAGEGRTRPLGTRGLEAQVTVVRTPTSPRLVWSWYRVAGEYTTSPARAKLLELLAFVRPSPASELVAVSAPCTRPDCSDAGTAILQFLTGSDLLPGATAP